MAILYRILAPAVAAAILAGCGASPTVWQKTIDVGGDETAVALAYDGTNFYAGANLADKSGGTTWLIRKLSRDGNEIWTQLYKQSATALLGDIAGDPNGSLFAAGRATVDGKTLCIVARYALDGSITWQRGLALGDKTWGSGICRLSGNRIAICGTAGTDANTDQMVAVLDGKDGKTLWTKNYDLSRADLGVRIAADARDNLAIVGQHGDGEKMDIVVIKVNPKGETLWTRRYDSGGDDTAGDIVFDPYGNVLAVGTARVGDSTRAVILEYDPDGGVVREAAYGQQAQATGEGIYVDAASDIFVCGTLFGKMSEVLAYQYKPNATSVWERHYSPGAPASGADLVVPGDAYVLATVTNATKDVALYRFTRPVPPRPAAPKAP